MQITAVVTRVVIPGLLIACVLVFVYIERPARFTPSLDAIDSSVSGYPKPARIIVMQPGADQVSDPIAEKVQEETGQHPVEELPTQEQIELEAEILSNVLNPSFRQSVTVGELIKQVRSLTASQQESITATVKTMMRRGEFSLEDFKQAELPRYKTVVEGAPLPTREEQAVYDQFIARLDDHGYVSKLTQAQLAVEIKSLPPALKQEVADKLNMMLEEGGIDPGVYIGPAYAGKSIRIFLH